MPDDGPAIVNIKILEPDVSDGKWVIKVTARGSTMGILVADTREEALAMRDDLIKMAEESGGQQN